VGELQFDRNKRVAKGYGQDSRKLARLTEGTKTGEIDGVPSLSWKRRLKKFPLTGERGGGHLRSWGIDSAHTRNGRNYYNEVTGGRSWGLERNILPWF